MRAAFITPWLLFGAAIWCIRSAVGFQGGHVELLKIKPRTRSDFGKAELSIKFSLQQEGALLGKESRKIRDDAKVDEVTSVTEKNPAQDAPSESESKETKLSRLKRLIANLTQDSRNEVLDYGDPQVLPEVPKRRKVPFLLRRKKEPIKVRSVAHMQALMAGGVEFKDISVTGEDPPAAAGAAAAGAAGRAAGGGGVPWALRGHAVGRALGRRLAEGSVPGRRTDGIKVGLAIEGGGMRGCVAAGAAAALEYLGYADGFDAVYGSSAGAVVGAYFVSRQLDAVDIYTQVLPTAGTAFVNPTNIPKAAFGLQLPRFMQKQALERRRRLRNEFRRAGSRTPLPVAGQVMSLDLLAEAMLYTRPLRWDVFWRNNQLQPLNVVVSAVGGPGRPRARRLSAAGGHFATPDQLLHCLKASSNVPAAVGPPLRFPAFDPAREYAAEDRRELLSDALVCEPMPYRSAAADGCTHVLVLRTRPNGAEVCGKNQPFYESTMCQRYCTRDYDLPGMADHFGRLDNVRIYADDVLTLNAGNRAGLAAAGGEEEPRPVPLPAFPEGGAGAGRAAHLLCLAPPAGAEEVAQMSLKRDKVVDGVRVGFETAYAALAPEALQQRISGRELARQLYPDSLLTSEVDLNRQVHLAPKEIAPNGKPHPFSFFV